MIAVGGLRGLLLIAVLASGCGPERGRSLDDLVLRDSTYLEPATLEPYTGRAFRTFPEDPEQFQLTGTLRDGVWHGELTVYHPNGRVRFQGRMSDGVQCGTWVEDAEEEPAPSLYEDIVSEIESLSIYPECPEGG